MKGLETGKDKIQKICDSLRKETLEPAKQEAREIIENAHLQAAEILKEAQKKATDLNHKTDQEIQEKQRVFQASLNLACRQSIEQLKKKITEELFDPQLSEVIHKEMAAPHFVADLLKAFMRSMEEKGIEEDFIALVPKEISPRSINALLTAKVLERLQNQTVTLGDFSGGIQIRLKGQKITIDISDAVIRELVAQYIRRDLRDLIFNS